MKTYITKSKSGHYSVTITNAAKTVVFKRSKLQSLTEAREVAEEFKKVMK